MRSFVIGGAGFVGSHLVDLLVARGPVTVYDNLSVGRREFIPEHLSSGRATLVEKDALDLNALTAAMAGHDVVFHLAANPEARRALENPRLDLEQGTIVTWNALEAARQNGVQQFVFASSGVVYGDTPEPCAEGDLGRLPFSLYGASKLAGESMLASYVECFGLKGRIARFGNVVGGRSTHGAILDFCNRLKSKPDVLEVLGDGRQSKPYVHVTDCAAGLLHIFDNATDDLAIFNLSPPDWTNVRRIAELCVASSPNPGARIEYGTTQQGWRGDVPTSRLDASKLRALGFHLRYTSDEAVARAVEAVARQVFG